MGIFYYDFIVNIRHLCARSQMLKEMFDIEILKYSQT